MSLALRTAVLAGHMHLSTALFMLVFQMSRHGNGWRDWNQHTYTPASVFTFGLWLQDAVLQDGSDTTGLVFLLSLETHVLHVAVFWDGRLDAAVVSSGSSHSLDVGPSLHPSGTCDGAFGTRAKVNWLYPVSQLRISTILAHGAPNSRLAFHPRCEAAGDGD